MTQFRRHHNDGGLVFGFIILGIGILLLLKKLGIFYPDWILTWPMILIAVGVITLVKSEFRSFFGLIMLGFGLYFLFEREFDFDLGLQRFIWPIILIVLGVYLISKKREENRILSDVEHKLKNRKTRDNPVEEGMAKAEQDTSDHKSFHSFSSGSGISGITFSDAVKIDAILSGINKRVMTKDLKGAKLTAFMGGIDLDLTQADIAGVATMQVDVIFGGVKLILPPHWDVRVEVTNIAAGVEDKRLYRQSEIDPDKVLVIKGTVLFGGLEIKSY